MQQHAAGGVSLESVEQFGTIQRHLDQLTHLDECLVETADAAERHVGQLCPVAAGGAGALQEFDLGVVADDDGTAGCRLADLEDHVHRAAEQLDANGVVLPERPVGDDLPDGVGAALQRHRLHVCQHDPPCGRRGDAVKRHLLARTGVCVAANVVAEIHPVEVVAVSAATVRLERGADAGDGRAGAAQLDGVTGVHAQFRHRRLVHVDGTGLRLQGVAVPDTQRDRHPACPGLLPRPINRFPVGGRWQRHSWHCST